MPSLVPGVPLQLPLEPWARLADTGQTPVKRACADLLSGAAGRHQVWLWPPAPQYSFEEGRMGGLQRFTTDGEAGPLAGGHDATWMGVKAHDLAAAGVRAGKELAETARGEGEQAGPSMCAVAISLAASRDSEARTRLHEELVEEHAVAADVERAVRLGTHGEMPPVLHAAGHRYVAYRAPAPVRDCVPEFFAQYAAAGAAGSAVRVDDLCQASYAIRMLPKALHADSLTKGCASLSRSDVAPAGLQLVHTVLGLSRRMPGFQQADMWGAVRFVPATDGHPTALAYECGDRLPPAVLRAPRVIAVWGRFISAQWCGLPHLQDHEAIAEAQERAARTAAAACVCVVA